MKLPYECCLPDDVWLYKLSDDKHARYGLGRMKKNGRSLLVCISSTPSYAEANLLDPTVAIVNDVAKKYGYDGWVMFNLYPEKTPDWEKLSSKVALYHAENIKIISRVFSALCEQQKGKVTVWAAWGAVVEARPYLKECLKDVLAALDNKRNTIAWKHIGAVVKGGIEHPRQPNPYRPNDVKKLTAFKVYGKGGYIDNYLSEPESETQP
ncbi:hypothetical protein Dip510_001347 [Elusimicrobium posterum]|uniref:DUF1643 domain-containing protein n=1 Tax=Elusimicrobium posterum TaxID=3116653 RepID=UPI003C748A9E